MIFFLRKPLCFVIRISVLRNKWTSRHFASGSLYKNFNEKVRPRSWNFVCFHITETFSIQLWYKTCWSCYEIKCVLERNKYKNSINNYYKRDRKVLKPTNTYTEYITTFSLENHRYDDFSHRMRKQKMNKRQLVLSVLFIWLRLEWW